MPLQRELLLNASIWLQFLYLTRVKFISQPKVKLATLLSVMAIQNKHFTPSRLNSLYSDFTKLRELNPEGFEANIQAWDSLLRDFVREGDSKICLDTHGLLNQLTLPIYGKPHLSMVLQELLQRKIIQPKNEFSGFVSYIRWLIPYKVKDDEEYIFTDLLAEVSKEALATIKDDTLFSRVILQARLSLNRSDLDLVLLWLYRHGECIVDGNYIKVGKTKLTDDDRVVISLEELSFKLDGKIGEYKGNISELEQEISDTSKKTNTKKDSHIVHILRRKLILRKALGNALSSKTEITAILIKISESKFNILMYNQLFESSKILKNLNGQVGDVHELKDLLAIEVERVDEISDSFSEELNEDFEDELDEELDGLYKEHLAEKERLEKERLEKERLGKKNLKESLPEESQTTSGTESLVGPSKSLEESSNETDTLAEALGEMTIKNESEKDPEQPLLA